MKTLNSFEELGTLSKEYRGQLPEYQKEGNTLGGKKYYEQDKYTPYQNILYKRAMHGLRAYKEDEIKKMHWQKKKRIKKIHAKAQRSVNILKQEYVNKLTNRIFEVWFPKAGLTQQLIACQETDPKFINKLDLKSLGINKDLVVERFIKDGVLPQDFHEKTEV